MWQSFALCSGEGTNTALQNCRTQCATHARVVPPLPEQPAPVFPFAPLPGCGRLVFSSQCLIWECWDAAAAFAIWGTNVFNCLGRAFHRHLLVASRVIWKCPLGKKRESSSQTTSRGNWSTQCRCVPATASLAGDGTGCWRRISRKAGGPQRASTVRTVLSLLFAVEGESVHPVLGHH